MRSVAVFGSSESVPGDRLYDLAREVGRILARSGLRVVTGGYAGVMEAASRGAVEEGGRTLGVTSATFRGRRPNAYLSETVEARDLHDRHRLLVDSSDAYVILSGKSGTLAEASLVWALHRAGSLDARPVVLLGDAWRRIVDFLAREGVLEGAELRVTRVAGSPHEIVGILRQAWSVREED